MDIWHYILLIFISMGAGFVQRVSGFGLGIFIMLFLPHFMPTHTAAAAISSLLSSVVSSINAVRYRKKVQYQIALPMIAAALVSIPIAVYFSAKVPGRLFQMLLGAVLILLSIYFIFLNKKLQIKPTVVNGLLTGTLSGTLNGLFSTGGPPAVLYLSSATTENISYFATIQFYFCFTNLYATGVRVLNGIITPKILLYAGIGIVGCMAGDGIGRIVFNRLDSDKLKIVIYVGMIISGVVMIDIF